MKLPNKLKKVQIDSRFKKGLQSKEFNMVQKVDKRGNKVNKSDTTMLKYYNIEDDEDDKVATKPEDASEDDAKPDNKYYDEDGKFKWEA